MPRTWRQWLRRQWMRRHCGLHVSKLPFQLTETGMEGATRIKSANVTRHLEVVTSSTEEKHDFEEVG